MVDTERYMRGGQKRITLIGPLPFAQYEAGHKSSSSTVSLLLELVVGLSGHSML